MTSFELRSREKHDFFMWSSKIVLEVVEKRGHQRQHQQQKVSHRLQNYKAGFNVYVEMVRCDTCPLTATIVQWQVALWCSSRQQMVAVLLCSFLDRIWRLEFGVPTSRWTSLWGAKEVDKHYKLICLERRDVLGMVSFLSHIRPGCQGRECSSNLAAACVCLA